nr:hypothetical protein [Tanacetum cinerariifolium]
MRIDPTTKRQKETTYQVVMDALAISTCYLAFLIMAKVPNIYMHQFSHTFYKHGSSYRFNIDNKKFVVTMEEFKDILNINPIIEEVRKTTTSLKPVGNSGDKDDDDEEGTKVASDDDDEENSDDDEGGNDDNIKDDDDDDSDENVDDDDEMTKKI